MGLYPVLFALALFFVIFLEKGAKRKGQSDAGVLYFFPEKSLRTKAIISFYIVNVVLSARTKSVRVWVSEFRCPMAFRFSSRSVFS